MLSRHLVVRVIYTARFTILAASHLVILIVYVRENVIVKLKLAARRQPEKVVPAYTVRKALNNTLSRFGSIICVYWLVSVSACQSSGPQYRVIESGFTKFEDLFTLVDTIRLDASVLIGQIGFVDMSDRGEFLVTDDVMRTLHVFTASGRHVRTIDISRCNPEDGGSLLSARFLTKGGMIATTPRGVYTINPDGSCNQRLLEIPPNRPSFCERQDTVYFMNHVARPPQIHAYSLESGNVRNYDLRKPKFPSSTAVKMGYIGRQIACFDRGIFYRYAESSDGEPLWSASDPVLFQPKSYRPPERDATAREMNILTSQLRELAYEFTYSHGIFGLDENHRLVTFQYPTEFNMNIVNMDAETSISTTDNQNLGIMLAKEGRMYTLGDYELLPSGETGNRTLEVWQFHPFESPYSRTRR